MAHHAAGSGRERRRVQPADAFRRHCPGVPVLQTRPAEIHRRVCDWSGPAAGRHGLSAAGYAQPGAVSRCPGGSCHPVGLRLLVHPYLRGCRSAAHLHRPGFGGGDGHHAGDVLQRLDRVRRRRGLGDGSEHRHHHHGQPGSDGGQHQRQTGGTRPSGVQRGGRDSDAHRLPPGAEPDCRHDRGADGQQSLHRRGCRGLQAHGHPDGPVAVPHVLQCGEHADTGLVHPCHYPHCGVDGEGEARGRGVYLPSEIHRRQLDQHPRAEHPGGRTRDCRVLETGAAHVHVPARAAHSQGRRRV